jgi:hypothetical protein
VRALSPAAGLGMRMEVVDAIVTEQDEKKLLRDVIAGVPPLGKRGRPTMKDLAEQADKGAYGTYRRGSNNVSYLARRLNRDRPDIAARIDDFPSMRAAAIAAGIIKPPEPLDVFQRLWAKMLPEERDAAEDHIANWRRSHGQAPSGGPSIPEGDLLRGLHRGQQEPCLTEV